MNCSLYDKYTNLTLETSNKKLYFDVALAKLQLEDGKTTFEEFLDEVKLETEEERLTSRLYFDRAVKVYEGGFDAIELPGKGTQNDISLFLAGSLLEKRLEINQINKKKTDQELDTPATLKLLKQHLQDIINEGIARNDEYSENWEHVNKYFDNHEGIQGYWDKAVLSIKAQYSISGDLDINDDSFYEKAFETAVFESNRKDTAKNELKEALSLIRTNEIDEFIGQPKFADFNPLYNKLSIVLAGSYDMSEMEKKLRKLAYIFPEYKQIYDKIVLPEEETLNKKDIVRLRNLFFSSFKNSYYNSTINKLYPQDYDQIVNNNGKEYVIGFETRIHSKVFHSNDNNPENILVKTWKENYNSLDKVKVKDKATKQSIELRNLFNTEKDPLVIAFKLAKAMKLAGIDITRNGKSTLAEDLSTEATYEAEGKEIEYLRDTFLKDTVFILDNLSKGISIYADDSVEDSFAQAQEGAIKNIAKKMSIYVPNVYESVSRNVKGDNVYNINQPSFFTEMIELFEGNSTEKVQALKELLEKYQKTYIYTYSNWLSDFIDEEGNVNLENTRKLKYYLIGGFTVADSDGSTFKDFTDKDGLIFGISQYYSGKKNQARFTLPTQSDAGNNYVLESKRIPLELTTDTNRSMSLTFDFYNVQIGKTERISLGRLSYDSEMYKSLKNNLLLEVARMRNARELMFEDDGKLKRVYVSSDKLTDAEKEDKQFMSDRKQAMAGLIQYYHFSKSTPDGEPIILDKAGKVTGNVFKFTYFPNANNETSLFDASGVISTDYKIVNSIIPRTIHDRIVNKLLKKTFEQYFKYGIDDFLENQALPAQFNHVVNDEKYNKEYLLADFALNYALFIVEYDNLFSGGNAFAKSAEDAVKRDKEVTAHHILQNSNDTFTGAYVKDANVPSKVYNSIKKSVQEYLKRNKPYLTKEELEAEVQNIVAPYEFINSTDSITFITPERYFSVLEGMGVDGRSDKVREAYDRIIAGTYTPEDYSIVLQPLKPFYFGMHYDTNLGIFVPVQVKNAEVMLAPNMVAGTDMEVILEALRDQKIDALIYESAAKKGASGVSRITNDNGDLDVEKLSQLNKKTFYNRFYGIQLETPESHMDYDAVMGLQPKKIILTDLRNEPIYKVNGVEEALTGQQLLVRHNKIESALVKKASESLLKRLGVVNTQGLMQTNDVRALHKILLDEIQRSNLNDNHIDAIDYEQVGEGLYQFNIPLYQTPSANKLEQVLLSLFTKNVTKQTIKGFGAIQSPGQFFKNTISGKTDLSSLPKGVRDKIQLIDRKKADYDKGEFELKSSEINNGEVVKMEVLLPATSKMYFKEGAKIDINDLPIELRTFLSYRIPFQGKYSSAIVEIVGFLPEEAGSNIVVPADVLVRMGSDFDIDKLFGMGYSFFQNPDGRFVIHTYDESPELVEARYDWYVKEAIRNTENKRVEELILEKKAISDLLKDWWIESQDDFVTFDDQELEINRDIQALDVQLKYLEDNDADRRSIALKVEVQKELTMKKFELYKLIQFKQAPAIQAKEERERKRDIENEIYDVLIQTGEILRFEEFSKLYPEEQNNQEAKKNAMLSDWLSVLSNPEHFVEQAVSTSFDKIKELAKKYGKGGTDSAVDRQLFVDQNRKAIAARQDKKLVGITASNNAYTLSILKNLKARVAYSISIPVRYNATDAKKYNIKERFPNETKELSDGSVIVDMSNIGWSNDGNGQNLSIKGDNISNNYSMVIGAATDGIKDPVLEYINFNTLTSNALGSVVILGHDWDFVAAIGNTPVVKRLTDLFFTYESAYNALSSDIDNRAEGLLKSDNNKSKAFAQVESEIFDKLGISYNDIEVVFGFDPNSIPIDKLSFTVQGLDNVTNTAKRIESGEEKDQKVIDANLKRQYLIFKLFQRLDSAGKAITENILPLRSDSVGAGPYTSTTNSLLDSILRASSNSLVVTQDGTSVMKRVYPHLFNPNARSVYSPVQSYLKESNITSLALYNQFFLKESESFKQIRAMVFGMVGKGYNEEMENKLNSFITTFLNKDHELFSSDYEELFKGENTLLDRIATLRISRPELFTENSLLYYLELQNSPKEIERNKGLKIINLKNTASSLNVTLQNILIEDWYNMLTNTEDDQVIRDIAIDLVKYNFHAFGLHASLLSFSHLIPVKWLKEIGYTEYLKNNVEKLDSSQIDALESFVQHNFRNPEIVPNTDFWRKITAEDNEELEYPKEVGSKLRIQFKPDSQTGVLKINPKTKNIDSRLKRPWINPYVLYRKKNSKAEIAKAKELGQTLERRTPLLFKYLGTDVDGNHYYRPLTKKGLTSKLYEFGRDSILHENFNLSDQEYILKLQEKGISLRMGDNAQTESEVKNHSMYYKMRADQNIYGEDTTTLELIERGLRTATTRSYPLGNVGDLITFEGRPKIYKITDVQKLTEENVSNPAWVEQWSQKEGWTTKYFYEERRKGSNTIKVGSFQTTFTEYEVRDEASTSTTPEFDKLPSKSSTPTFTYAGVGSRETPKEVQETMTKIAKYLESLGYTLNTGDADAADASFRAGTNKKNVFTVKDATDRTRTIAREIHPSPFALDNTKNPKYVWDLMARNTNQVFGANLDTPIDFLIAWTPDGITDGSQRSVQTGGTGQAIDMASRKGIPVINMANPNWRQELNKVLSKKTEEAPKTSGQPINVYSTEKNGFQGLSNLLNGPVTATVNGKTGTYRTVEHLYQVKKALFAGDKEAAKVIFESKTGWDAQRLSRNINMSEDKRKEWDNISSQELESAMRLAFEQNEASRNLLLSTGNAPLTHTSGKFKLGKWETEFPRILMQIRSELDKQESTVFGEQAIEDAISTLTEKQSATLDAVFEKEKEEGESKNDYVLRQIANQANGKKVNSKIKTIINKILKYLMTVVVAFGIHFSNSSFTETSDGMITPVQSSTRTDITRDALKNLIGYPAAQYVAATLFRDVNYGVQDAPIEQQIELYKSIVNADKRTKGNYFGTEYIDYSPEIDEKLQDLKGDLTTNVKESFTNPKFQAATTFGRVSVNYDKDTKTYYVYDQYDFSQTPEAKEGYASFRSKIGNVASATGLGVQEGSKLIGTFSKEEWDLKVKDYESKDLTNKMAQITDDEALDRMEACI